jgi:hypothetical protein
MTGGLFDVVAVWIEAILNNLLRIFDFLVRNLHNLIKLN